MAVLMFDEFHYHDAYGFLDYSAGFLASSAITAVFVKMIAILLLFRFEGYEKPTRKDLAIAWVPFVLLGFGAFEYLLGLLFWYIATYSAMSSALMGAQVGVLFLATFLLSHWMWKSMRLKGGLGVEERHAERVADK